jgi:hypothetical protein
MSFTGYVTAAKGSVLLGGVKHHESSRFETMQQASDWVAAIVRGNCEAHRAISAWGVNHNPNDPEIRVVHEPDF